MYEAKKHNINSEPFSRWKKPTKIKARGRLLGPIQKRHVVKKGAINQAVTDQSQFSAIAEDVSLMEQFYGNDSLGG